MKRDRRAGFSYVEVLVAVAVLALSLPSAIEALRTGLLSGQVHQTLAETNARLSGKLEWVLARSFSELEQAALAAAGGPSAFSDPAGTPERRLVFLLGHDGDDADADGNPATGIDPGLLRVRVEIEGTHLGLETLTTD